MITAEEWQLLSFFEAEPKLLDPAEPWCFNDAAYKTADGTVELSFAVAPSYSDVRIILSQNGRTLYELNAMGVHDVVYTNESGAEQLVVQINAGDWLVLSVKPRIFIRHEAQETERGRLNRGS